MNFECQYYHVMDSGYDDEDYDTVFYGPKNSGAGCGEPSFSIWCVPGTMKEDKQ
jgi:hypothetical protein